MKIAIVDDDRGFRNEIYEVLHSTYRAEHIDLFENGVSFLNENKHYDVVLLDIDMPELNGIEVRDKLHLHNTFIIFVSSHTEMIKEAFGENIMGFVEKDTMKTELLPLLNKVEQKLGQIHKYTFKSDNEYVSFHEAEILCFKLENRNVYVYTVYERRKINIQTLKNVNFSTTFCQINRNEVINIQHIKSIKDNVVCLKYCDITFIVSRERLKGLKLSFMDRVLK